MPDTRTPIDPKCKHGIDHILGINGLQFAPDRVNLDTVVPVIDMNQGGHARAHDPNNTLFKLTAKQIALPAANWEDWLISYGNNQAVGAIDMVYRPDTMLRIISMSFEIQIVFDPAGSVINGRTFRVILKMQQGLNWVPFWQSTHEIYHIPLSARSSRTFNYEGDWSCQQDIPAAGDLVTRDAWGSLNQIRCPILMPGWGVKAMIVPNCLPAPDPSYFTLPALSSWQFRTLAQQVPIGACVPSYW